MPEAPEYAIYVVLKIDACQRESRGHAGRPAITARRLHQVLDRLARSGRGALELCGVTPHFVRERLRDLNHGTALHAVDLAGPPRYVLTEVLSRSMMHSFHQMRLLLGGRPFFGLDIGRLEAQFQGDAFTADEFVELFKALRDRGLLRRWYSLATSADTDDARYTRFLGQRLRELVSLGLIAAAGERYRLTARAFAACHWFQLMLHSVDYPTSNAAQESPGP